MGATMLLVDIVKKWEMAYRGEFVRSSTEKMVVLGAYRVVWESVGSTEDSGRPRLPR
jgi:hypothetical protein